MEDGTVSIFGLVFGVAATTNSNSVVLVAGASGAAAAAVSMMAGSFLESETDRDEKKARQQQLETDLKCDPGGVDTMLAERLTAVGLERPQAGALAGAVRDKPDAIKALLIAMQGGTAAETNPIVQAVWMLVADFFSAAVPIVPFMLMPVASARIVSAGITILLLAALGVGRGIIGKRSHIHTILETVGVGHRGRARRGRHRRAVQQQLRQLSAHLLCFSGGKRSQSRRPMPAVQTLPNSGDFSGQSLACRRGERLIFRGLDFALPPGGALVLIGPNGSGKSSLLRLMAGLTPREAGLLAWNGTDIREDLARASRPAAFHRP